MYAQPARCILIVFFFNDTATTEIYTLSLHDALPISMPDVYNHPTIRSLAAALAPTRTDNTTTTPAAQPTTPARSEEHTSELRHANISYAVFCLKKKKYNPACERSS